MRSSECLLDEAEFCRLANLKPATVRKQRVFGGGPPFIKIGRSVRYRPADVEAWLEGRTVQNTAAARQVAP